MLKGKLTPIRFLQGTISKVAEVVGSNIQPIRIYENGIYEVSSDVDGFNPVYVDTPEPKEEQEKIVDIIENGTVEILPDGNKALSKVTIKSNVPDTSGIIEDVIDESGVLDSTEGTVTEKVEELIDKAEELDAFMNITDGASLFKSAKSFPTKATVNLPNATTVYQAFNSWIANSIPMVEEITVNAPNATANNAITQMFYLNHCVKKITLSVPNTIQSMNSTFSNASNLEEVVLNFLTKNIKDYASSFANCKKLIKINGVLDFSSATNVGYMFASCVDLKEITFKPNTLSLSKSLNGSSKLSADSIQSIIDGLATVGTAQTLTLAKAIVLTDAQKKAIQDKGWTLVQ